MRRKTNGAYETILVSTKGKVGLITLNRPHALNALNAELIGELNRALDGFEADPGIGCIVITGNEKAFAAGVDIKEMHKKTFVEAYGSDFLAPFDRISQLPQADHRRGRRAMRSAAAANWPWPATSSSPPIRPCSASPRSRSASCRATAARSG